ncbi:MAG TPA: hypothetical protein PKD51_09990 [Saprospiraceae bacterium]|nr:hypothetical protein [Saprospiraceae bacterium]
MNINNQTKLYKSALEHKASPKPDAWNRIQEKLGQDKKVVKMPFSKYMWIAAAFIGIVGVLTIFNSNNTISSGVDAVASTQGYSEQIEVLDINSEPGIYEIQKLAGLKVAYKKLSEKSGM